MAASLVVGVLAGALLVVAPASAGATTTAAAPAAGTAPRYASSKPIQLPDGHKAYGIYPAVIHRGIRPAVTPAPTPGALSYPCKFTTFPKGCHTPLKYGGTGGVLGGTNATGAVTVDTIFWDPTATKYAWPANYKSIIDAYLKNVQATDGTGTNDFAVATQYYQTVGGTRTHVRYNVKFGSQITVTADYPTTANCPTTGTFTHATTATSVCLTSTQVQNELTKVLTANGLPANEAHFYLLYLPPKVETCSKKTGTTCSSGATNGTYCGYHTEFGTTVFWGTMPFPFSCETTVTYPTNSPNSTPSADTMISITAHEVNEAITDPSGGSSWITTTTTEIGDLCAYQFGAPQGSGTTKWNQTINGTHYFTQLMFSDEAWRATGTKNGCVGSAVLPTTSFAVPSTARAGQSASFTGSTVDPDAYFHTTTVDYTWSWGDGSAKSGPSTSATASHTYTAKGTYTVTLTVTDADGWSAAVSHQVTVKPAPNGYLQVASDGGIFTFGSAGFYGSEGGKPLNAPIVGMAATPTGGGYWEVASDGGIFTFGNAGFYGSEGGKPLNKPIVGMAAMPTGKGYWMVASDGGIFSFGTAGFYGSEGGKPLNKPIVGMAAMPTGKGYWEVASDGGIFTFGTAGYYGSEGGKPLNAPIVGMAAMPTGKGYWEVASDGGIFTFGTAGYYGSEGGKPLNKPIVGMAAV